MIQQALDNATVVKPDLWAINNIFTSDELSNLLHKIETTKNWQAFELQENRPRQAMEWVDNGLLDQVWCSINELDFSKFRLKFKTVTIWRDLPTYFIGDHVDNDRVMAAMQIYLNLGPKNLGTWFQDSYIPFVPNTGYIMINKNKLVHGMKNAVPNEFIRYSLYAWFDIE
jgi:hypothetical protein